MRTLKGHNGPVRCLAYSPDSTRLVSGGDDLTVRFWEAGEPGWIIQNKGDWVRGLAISPDGRNLAAGDWTGTVCVNRIKPLLRTHHTHEDHAGGVWSVGFSPDGYLLVAGAGDGTLHFYHGLDEPKPRKVRGHQGPVSAVAFTPDGRTLATSSHDRTVRLWDANWGNEMKKLTGHDDWVRGVAVSGDGKRLAS